MVLGQIDKLCHFIFKEFRLHPRTAIAADLFLVGQNRAQGTFRRFLFILT